MKHTRPKTKDFKNKGKRNNIEAYEKAYDIYCDSLLKQNADLLGALMLIKYIAEDDRADFEIRTEAILNKAKEAIKSNEK